MLREAMLREAIIQCQTLCDKYTEHLGSVSDKAGLLTEKQVIVEFAKEELIKTGSTTEERLANFFKKLDDKSVTLKTRRDSALITFLKGLAVVLSSILPIVGNILAWKMLFGSGKTTHGGLLIDATAKYKDAVKKAKETDTSVVPPGEGSQPIP